MKKGRSSPYHTYLLRCWQESPGDGQNSAWRFSLECVQDQQRQGFADLNDLLAFLQALTRAGSERKKPDRPLHR